MTHVYSDADSDVETVHKRVHSNGEVTYVYILEADERYVGIAADVDPREFAPIEGEIICFTPTVDGAKEQTLRWLEQNPKGIIGGDSGSGFVDKLGSMAKKLNDYGNNLADQNQNNGT